MPVEGEPGGKSLHHLLFLVSPRNLSGSFQQGRAEERQPCGPPPVLHALSTSEEIMITAQLGIQATDWKLAPTQHQFLQDCNMEQPKIVTHSRVLLAICKGNEQSTKAM